MSRETDFLLFSNFTVEIETGFLNGPQKDVLIVVFLFSVWKSSVRPTKKKKSGSQPGGGEASVYAALQRFAPFFMYHRKKQVVQENAVKMRG